MVIKNVTDAILHGVSGDTKPTSYPANTILLEQDTGNIYSYNGSSWNLFRGASKTETLSNKTIDAANQTDMKKMLTADFVKETGMLVPCPSGLTSSGWLLGLTLLGSGALQAVDSSHGLSELYTSGTVANTSQAGQKSANPFTYRAWNPYFRLKCSLGSVLGDRFFAGFSSSSTTPTSDTFLQNGDSGVGVGFRDVDNNWFVFNNDGSGAMVTADTGVATDTAINSFEIVFDNSVPNCVVKVDGVTEATLTTRIPASGTALNLYFFVEPTGVSAKTLKLYNTWYEHKRTVAPL